MHHRFLRRAPLALPFLVALVLSSPSFAETERSFVVTSGGRLEVDAQGASVKVETADVNTAQISVERKNSSRAIADDFDVKLDQASDGTVRVNIEKKNKMSWGRNDHLTVYAKVPRQFDLDVETSGGSLSVTDLEGDIDVRTSGGSVKLGQVTGSVMARTSGGSIQLDGSTVTADLATSGGSITVGDVAGAVKASTSGGSVRVERADGDVDVSTSGGSITLANVSGSINAQTSGGSVDAEFTRQPTRDSKISTSGGSVRVEIAQGLAFDLSAQASSGVRVDVPVEIQGRVDRNKIEGKVNGGGPALVLRASGGKVTVGEE